MPIGGIEIDRTSNHRERRKTLTHEIVHVARGPIPAHPYYAMREEREVNRITARLLIKFDDLIDARLESAQGRRRHRGGGVG